MKSRVFVVQESGTVNFLPAAKFGEIQPPLLPPGDVFLSPGRAVRTIRERLRDFGDNDFLVLAGDWVGMAIVAQVAADINNGRVKFLRWEKHEKDYVPVEVDIHLRPRRRE